MPIKAMRFIALVLLCPVAIFAVAGCSSGSNSSSNPITNPPPVSGQTTYSNSALSGTYSISTGIYSGAGGCPSGETGVIAITGTMQFDGNGNIMGGTIQYPVCGQPANNPRVYSLKGTYSVSSSASGTATLTFTQTSGSTDPGLVPLIPSATPYAFNLQAAQQGASVILAESDGLQYIDSIIALKQ
jgi:hypothetical protein